MPVGISVSRVGWARGAMGREAVTGSLCSPARAPPPPALSHQALLGVRRGHHCGDGGQQLPFCRAPRPCPGAPAPQALLLKGPGSGRRSSPPLQWAPGPEGCLSGTCPRGPEAQPGHLGGDATEAWEGPGEGGVRRWWFQRPRGQEAQVKGESVVVGSTQSILAPPGWQGLQARGLASSSGWGPQGCSPEPGALEPSL